MRDERIHCNWRNAVGVQCSTIARYNVVYLFATGRSERSEQRAPRCDQHVMEAIEFVMVDQYPYWFHAVEPIR